MNYLQLCQRLHLYLRSGTGETPGSLPTSVAAQTGELLQITTHIAQAWEDIQREYPDWLWMQAEGTIETVAGTQDYSFAPTDTFTLSSLTSSGTTATGTTAAPHGFIEGQSVTIAGATPSGYNGTFTVFGLTPTTFNYTLGSALASPATGTITAEATRAADRLLPWYARNDREPYLLAYTTATGTTDEQPVYFREPGEFLGYYDRGAYVSRGRPVYYTYQPNRVLSVFPLPDKAYTIRYRYRKQISRLLADGATPEMPSEYHIAIVLRAMQYMSTADRNSGKFKSAVQQYQRVWDDLVMHQRPRIPWTY